jgi:hypothetical protein
VRHAQSIADRIQVVSDLELVNFAVEQANPARWVDEDRRIVKLFSVAFDEPGDYEYAGLNRSLCETLRVWPGNRLRKLSR